MALCTLALEQKPTDVALSKSGTRLAVLANNHLAVYALDVTTRPITKPSLLWHSDALEGQSARHVAFLDDEQLYVLTDSWVDDESSLWRSEDQMLLPLGPLIENDGISSLAGGVDYRDLYVQLQNGAIHRIDTSEAASDLPPQTALTQKFPAFAPDFKIANVDGQVRKLSAVLNIMLIWTGCCLWSDQEWRAVRQRTHLGA
jgi:elongator complex protein 1